MEPGTRRIFTIAVITFLLGMTLLANRKKIKAALQRRVSRIDHRHKDLVHAVGEHL